MSQAACKSVTCNPVRYTFTSSIICIDIIFKSCLPASVQIREQRRAVAAQNRWLLPMSLSGDAALRLGNTAMCAPDVSSSRAGKHLRAALGTR